MTIYDIPVRELNSSGIEHEFEGTAITHVRFLAEGGEGENHISVYAWEQVFHPGGDYDPQLCEGRVARTNGLPVFEDNDEAAFAELLESVGLEVDDLTLGDITLES